MAVSTTVLEASNIVHVLCGSTAVSRGDLVYNDGTDWELADASAIGTYAMAVAVTSAPAGGMLTIAQSAVLHDGDDDSFSGTDADQLYLSETAGGITSTRPTTAVSVRQVVGRAFDRHGETGGTIAVVNINPAYEYSKPLINGGATSAYAVLDSGNFGGFTLDAQNETQSFVCMVPENAIGVEIGQLFVAAEATSGTPTMDITIGSAIDGAQHDGVTADATLTNQAAEGSAADEMNVLNITTGLDATDIIRPGALLGIKCLADDGGTDIRIVFGGDIVFKCV